MLRHTISKDLTAERIRARSRRAALGCAVAAIAGGPALAGGTEPEPAPALRLMIGDAAVEPASEGAVIRLGDGAGTGGDADDPVECLTDAVYYEARSESLAGQQAVAQVVINRTRLSMYPSSICGVVFQRTGETSGCQFSFVCDGSMYRAWDAAAWDRARAVAARALAGFVYKPMAGATHFHAAWMTPYWSASTARIGQIGGHIFYR